MELKISVIAIVLLAACTNAQLLCFHCNDCAMQAIGVQPCGINYATMIPPEIPTQSLPDTTTVMPTITPEVPPFETTTVLPPDTTTSSSLETTTVLPETTTVVPPITTTVEPETTMVVTPELTTALPPITTNPPTDSPATPTLPTTISTTFSSVPTSGDLATPPITPFTEETNSRLVISLEPPSPRYVCLAIKSIVDNREVVRRGCAQLGHTVHDTCNSASGGQHTSCSVCMTHLCNRG